MQRQFINKIKHRSLSNLLRPRPQSLAPLASLAPRYAHTHATRTRNKLVTSTCKPRSPRYQIRTLFGPCWCNRHPASNRLRWPTDRRSWWIPWLYRSPCQTARECRHPSANPEAPPLQSTKSLTSGRSWNADMRWFRNVSETVWRGNTRHDLLS